MSAPIDWLAAATQQVQAEHLWRWRRTVTPLPGGWCELSGRRLKNLAGNDYLNLAHDPRVIEALQHASRFAGSGVTASPLVSGRSPWHVELEETLAAFHGEESAVLFPTGYAANVGTIAALATPDDVIFCDRLNHACLVDGCRLSGARLRVYRHTELERLRRHLQGASSARQRWIVTDSVFSMDGNVAPLVELTQMAQETGAHLILDEAHGLGILGEQGRGAAELLGVEPDIAVRIGTLSKAIGALGGFVVGSTQLTDWLWNKARPQMFSTALPAPICAAATAAVRIIQAEPERRQYVLQLAADLRTALRQAAFTVPEGAGPIVPVILETPERTLSAARALEEAGYLAAAIRPPTVPQGSSRLRLTITAACTVSETIEVRDTLIRWRTGIK